MPNHQKYPVTLSEKPPEQPHMKNDKDEKSQHISCVGWCAFATAGIIAVTFLLCITLIPSKGIFPVHVNIRDNFVPIVQQGNLQIYPPYLNPEGNIWTNDTYTISLLPENLQDTVDSIQKVINEYPKTSTGPYKLCWLQNPSRKSPCYFDPTWLGDSCTRENNFGYIEVNGTFSPCFLIRVEKATTWRPLPEWKTDLPQPALKNYDPNFVQVVCYRKDVPNLAKYEGIRLFPEKGFSLFFFPASAFDSKLYLTPAIAVQIKGIQKGNDVQVECVIEARNSLLLWDNGIVTITFTSSNIT